VNAVPGNPSIDWLCVEACRQKRRVRFTTAAGLVTNWWKPSTTSLEGLARWSRYDLIAIDEVGSALAEVGGRVLFQVVAERAEKAP